MILALSLCSLVWIPSTDCFNFGQNYVQQLRSNYNLVIKYIDKYTMGLIFYIQLYNKNLAQKSIVEFYIFTNTFFFLQILHLKILNIECRGLPSLFIIILMKV